MTNLLHIVQRFWKIFYVFVRPIKLLFLQNTSNLLIARIHVDGEFIFLPWLGEYILRDETFPQLLQGTKLVFGDHLEVFRFPFSSFLTRSVETRGNFGTNLWKTIYSQKNYLISIKAVGSFNPRMTFGVFSESSRWSGR